jgi:MtN3 and saliva related transmembrane protein
LYRELLKLFFIPLTWVESVARMQETVKNKDKPTHQKKQKKVIDFYEIIGLIAAFITTASFLPQVFKTYKTKDTSGLSLTMYVTFFIGIVLWLIYGIHLKSVPIILANAITAVLALSLVIMKLKYK